LTHSEVHVCELAEHARDLFERTVWSEQVVGQRLVLHGDNGSPHKGSTVQTLLGSRARSAAPV